ncbi:unnamed protein product [Orchesella dallaii]|uniref:Uncharacterized protein n=1 Tax=Orchesella dallaii TaxID=48710 RepID=A0ABP1QPT3_9HEXA
MNRLLRKYLFLVVSVTLVILGIELLWSLSTTPAFDDDYDPNEEGMNLSARQWPHHIWIYEPSNDTNETITAFEKLEIKRREIANRKHQNLLVRPWTGGEYNLNNSSLADPSKGEAYYLLREYFKFRIQGFFVEYRAFDGETKSKTLLLEREFGWHGLLIEPHPVEYKKLVLKNRKSWTANTCLATKNTSHTVKVAGTQMFYEDEDLQWYDWTKVYSVNCHSLEELIISGNGKRITQMVIDLFYLDTGAGFELKVLRMIPLDKLLIKVISVKIKSLDAAALIEGIQGYLQYHGYRNALDIRFKNRPTEAQIIYVHLNSSDLVHFADME